MKKEKIKTEDSKKQTTSKKQVAPKKKKQIKCCGVREDGAMWYESAKMEAYKWYQADGAWFYKGPYDNVFVASYKDENFEKVALKIKKKQGVRNETGRKKARTDSD